MSWVALLIARIWKKANTPMNVIATNRNDTTAMILDRIESLASILQRP